MPNASELKNDFVNGASGASAKLVDRYTKRTDKAARAASDDAQNAYKQAMADPKVIARRQSMLKKVTEEEMNAAMRAKGGSAYAAGVANAGDKWANKVQPFFDTIDQTVAKLPARTRDVAANVQKRVTPIAVALRAKKESMG